MSQRLYNPCLAARELLDVLASKVIIKKKVHFIQLRGVITLNKQTTLLSCVSNNNTENKRGLRKQENAPLLPTIRCRSCNDFLCLMFFHRGNTPETRGTAYVVYEDIFDAKNACDHLSGFNVCNRYLVVLYYNANRVRMSITSLQAQRSSGPNGSWRSLKVTLFPQAT